MPLSSEVVYNDLNGSDCKEILMVRFADLLNQVKEFAPHLTLPRVRMSLIIHLDIWGRTPAVLEIEDDLILRMRDLPPSPGSLKPDPEDVTEYSADLRADINSDTTSPEGQPPDLIREEHGIPVMTPQKGPFGMEDVPVLREGVKYASFITQDYGPRSNRTGFESPVLGGDVISQKNAGARPDIKADMTKVRDPEYKDHYDPLDINGQLNKLDKQ